MDRGTEGCGNGALVERSTRVLPALMETRSREPPLTAAKPIYLRPRLFSLVLSLTTSFPRPRILLVTEFVPDTLSPSPSFALR